MVHGSQVALIHSHPRTQVPSILLFHKIIVAPSLWEEGERNKGEKTGIDARARPEVTPSLLLTFHWPELSHTAKPSCKRGWEM